MQQDSFGYWLKRKRKSLGLTQAELGVRVGCSAAAIRKIEAEERRPSAQIVSRLAEIFEIPASERTVFLRFARGEMRAMPAETKENYPWQAFTKPARSNLPAMVTSFIGRKQETSLLHGYLLNPDIRLVSLIGPPGIGKTRLSIEAARAVLPDFSDGVFFVPLAPLDEPSLLGSTIAHALGYVETTHQPASEQLEEGIRDKYILLVLDNCEHLIEDVAALVSGLLSACSRLKVLATSRELLRIPGEWIYPIPTLNVPDENSSVAIETISEFPALTLFAERARAVRPEFVLDAENIQSVTSICTRLDGLPLAIELMAARMRFITPKALLEHLNGEFISSADGMRSISSRQKTLNDAIAWSYNLLSEEEQRFFACLSVFSGGFTLQAAETIFSEMFASTSLSGLLTSLLDKSLLQRTFETRDEFRFDMLVTIQQFAMNRLQSMGKEAEARNRHLLYFLTLAEQAGKEIHGTHQVEWLHHLGAVRDNLRSALEWAIETQQTEAALKIANNLSLFWFRRSDLSEGRQWLGRVLQLIDSPQYPSLYSYALAQMAFHTWLQTGSKEARPFIEEALSVASAYDDKWTIAWALMVLGLVLIYEGNFMAARSTLEESKVLFRDMHDEWGYANALISLGLGAYNQDDQANALSLHEESLVIFRKLGDRYFESVALRFIGALQLKRDDLAQGVIALSEALILSQQLDSKYEIAANIHYFAEEAQRAEQFARAVCLYWASRNIFDSIGVWKEENVPEFENELNPCRAMLSAEAFTEAMDKGCSMSIDQAAAYALED